MSFLPISQHRSWPDPNCDICNAMREPGLEPGRLSTLDPKADPALRLPPHGDPLFPLKASSHTPFDATGQKVAPLPSGMAPAPAATRVTTSGATWTRNGSLRALGRMLGPAPIITIEPTRNARGFVYCVRRPDSRAIKIGFTRDITKRMEGLQCANDATLELLFYFPATARCEQRLLVQFQPWRKSGEWFRSSKEVKGWIKEQSAVDGVIVPRKR